jgi:hypothetical protein
MVGSVRNYMILNGLTVQIPEGLPEGDFLTWLESDPQASARPVPKFRVGSYQFW